MRTTLAALLAIAAGACESASPPPPRVEVDPELAGFELAASWPDPPDALVMTLAAGLHASLRRDAEAFAFFEERIAADPERGLFWALAGLFQARMAGQITLLDRVAWVEDAVAKLDHAVELDPGLSRFVRGATLARLPARFGEARRAVDDLRATLDDPDSYIRRPDVPEILRGGVERSAWQALAFAHDVLGEPAASADALVRAGGRSLDPDEPLLATSFAVTAADGFRFGRPHLWSPAPDVWVARNYDFSDIGFVVTSDGVVAIDAGTTEATAAAALAAFRAEVTAAPIRAVILTHGHWDHVGGLAALREPGTEVIAQAEFHAERARIAATGVPWRWFFGQDFVADLDVTPDRLVGTTETLTFGAHTLVLHPVRGGETEDALLIEVPAAGVVFVGDAFMPYLGAPFVSEGSPQELLNVAALLETMAPDVLVHGHGPLTDFMTADVMAPLGEALAEVERAVRDDIAAGRPLAEILERLPVPELLRDHPEARMPFLLAYRQFAQRMQRQSTGYWQSDLAGLEVRSPDERAAALDGLGGGRPEAWATTVTDLITRGDFGLALELADLGARAHPASVELAALHARALDGLRERYQLFNPFKFIIYSERAGVETPPLR